MHIDKVISRIENVCSKHTKIVNAISVILFACMFSITAYLKNFTNNWYALMIIACSGISLILMVLNCTSTKVKITKTGIALLFFEAVIGISFLINGVAFKTKGLIAVGMVFSIVFPMLQYFFATCGLKKFIDIMAKGIAVSYILLLIISVLFGPKLRNFQYESVLLNKNTLGQFVGIIIPSCTYLFLKESKHTKMKLAYWALFVSSIALLFFCSARTAMLSVAVMLIYLIIIEIAKVIRTRQKPKIKVPYIISYIIITIAVPLILFFLLTTVRGLIIKHIGNSTLFYPTYTGQSTTQIPIDDNNGADLPTDFSFDYLGKGINNDLGEDNLTSGRMTIWKEFLSNMKFSGHAVEYRVVTSDTRTFNTAYAHNVYIQVAYSAGIIAGVAYLIFVIICGIKILVYFVKVITGKEKYDLCKAMCYCFMIVFCISSLAETIYMPFTRFNASCFWFLSFCCMYELKSGSKTSTNKEEESPAS